MQFELAILNKLIFLILFQIVHIYIGYQFVSWALVNNTQNISRIGKRGYTKVNQVKNKVDRLRSDQIKANIYFKNSSYLFNSFRYQSGAPLRHLRGT